jgi:DNA-directed RNA polymerase subunit K/omega
LRAEMISNGAVPFVDIPNNIISSIDIATLEYIEKKIPLIIRRYHSDKTYEDWRLQDMIDIN